MTDATPTPMPPTTRNKHEHPDVRAPDRRADRTDQEEQRGDLHHRDAADLVGDPACGHRAGGRTEQRRRDGETESTNLPMLKCSWIAATAPLMTALSYPNSRPPSAATEAIRTTRPLCSDSS